MLTSSPWVFYVAPWAALLGWLLFGPRPRIDWTTFALAFIWPAAYILFTFVRGKLTGIYPYPFVDARQIGFATAFSNAMLVLVVGMVLAVIFTAVDLRLTSRPRLKARP